MSAQDIIGWTERELIDRVYHELNQSSTIARGLIAVLQTTEIGAMNDRQQGALNDLQRHIANITEANTWLRIWIRARSAEE